MVSMRLMRHARLKGGTIDRAAKDSEDWSLPDGSLVGA
jgi:hypothetical protein